MILNACLPGFPQYQEPRPLAPGCEKHPLELSPDNLCAPRQSSACTDSREPRLSHESQLVGTTECLCRWFGVWPSLADLGYPDRTCRRRVVARSLTQAASDK